MWKIDHFEADEVYLKFMTSFFDYVSLCPDVCLYFRILHASGFSELEIVMQKSIIYNNIVSAMTKIINAMDKFHINFEELEREVKA